jgi:hypothetical protein
MGERQAPLMMRVIRDMSASVECLEEDVKRALLAVAHEGLNCLPASSPWYATLAQIRAACDLPPRVRVRPVGRSSPRSG